MEKKKHSKNKSKIFIKTSSYENRRAPCWKFFKTVYSVKDDCEYDYCEVILTNGTKCGKKYLHNGSTKNHNRHLKKHHNITEVRHEGNFQLKS